MVAHACNLSTLQVEAGGSKVQGHPLVLTEFEVSLLKGEQHLTEHEKACMLFRGEPGFGRFGDIVSQHGSVDCARVTP